MKKMAYDKNIIRLHSKSEVTVRNTEQWNWQRKSELNSAHKESNQTKVSTISDFTKLNEKKTILTAYD